MKPVFFHPEAQAEFFAAQDFYEQRVEGLGEDFRQEVIAATDVIRAAPQRWPGQDLGHMHLLRPSVPIWDGLSGVADEDPGCRRGSHQP